MSKWATINDWLLSEDNGGQDVLSAPLDPMANQPVADAQPAGMPGAGAAGPPSDNMGAKNPMEEPVQPGATGQATPQMAEPVAPDVPDEEQQDQNFEQWKSKYFKETVKGDVTLLLDLINSMRNKDLDTYPRKFLEDNLQVCYLRQNANIEKASQQIRKSIREQLDHNNPSMTLVQSIMSALQPMPELSNVFIKMLGLYSNKADLHRKYVAALLGGVQVGSGGANEDIIFNQKEYSIRISTRMQSKFGMIDLGKWNMDSQDPEKFLSESELDRLENGSPDEKEVLRKRVILESIADNFSMRAFIMNVVDQNGTIYFIGSDFSNALRDAYTEGKIAVKSLVNDYAETFYNTEGQMVALPEIKIMYNTNTGKLNSEGEPVMIENEFITRRDGMLFLTASLEILKEASTSFQGLIIKEIPYVGNPSDIQTLVRCVPSAPEIILRNC
jgi:hypothetical protein